LVVGETSASLPAKDAPERRLFVRLAEAPVTTGDSDPSAADGARCTKKTSAGHPPGA